MNFIMCVKKTKKKKKEKPGGFDVENVFSLTLRNAVTLPLPIIPVPRPHFVFQV